MASPQSALRQSELHVHVAGQKCPTCDQPIPNEKAELVRARVAARDRELSVAVEARLRDQFAQERAEYQAAAHAAAEKLQTEAAAKETAAREEGRKAAVADMQQRLTALEEAKAESEAAARERIAQAETAKQVAEAEAKALKENQETALNERLAEQREALEKDKTAAVLAEQAKAFEDRQKLQSSVQSLQRQVEKQRADELGEGAEINLYEVLKATFEGDRIRRVEKGTPGADVIHEVIHHNKVCGQIVYDSKNRNAWQNAFVTKLRADQIAQRADHAILSSNKFPAGARQLHMQEGVIIACPARVVALAELLRNQIIQMHELRLSNEEREGKTAELYAFITSERCSQLLDSVATLVERLLDLDVAEQKKHTTVWAKRGTLLKSVLKAHGDLCFEFDRILGTATAAD